MLKSFNQFINEAKEESSEALPKVGQEYKGVNVRTQEGTETRDVKVVSVYKRDREALVRTSAGGDAVVSFKDLAAGKLNERFEEMDQPGFFGRARRGIQKLFRGEPKFGEENHFSTISQIVGALAGGRASLRVKQDEGVAGGWVKVGGRERSFVLDIDERGMVYDGREIELDREQAEMLWQAVTDWDDAHNPKSQLDWED